MEVLTKLKLLCPSFSGDSLAGPLLTCREFSSHLEQSKQIMDSNLRRFLQGPKAGADTRYLRLGIEKENSVLSSDAFIFSFPQLIKLRVS
jgi:hypothetical protein